MNQQLPRFRYHLDPLTSGAIINSNKVCQCCNMNRGFIYDGPTYAIQDLSQAFCPWCIADGSAARKFDAVFVDDRSLVRAQLAPEIISEVTTRTPGCRSWQTDEWLSHCGDAAAFCGDASLEEVAHMKPSEQSRFLLRYQLDQDEFGEMLESYTKGGDPGIYKFQCLHCGVALFGMDCT